MNNDRLRRHLTRVGFNLQLATSQVNALVAIEYARERVFDTHQSHSCTDSWFITGMNGLQRRGLIEHHYPPIYFEGDGTAWMQLDYNDRSVPLYHFYDTTPAGDAVVVLLRESGLWDEVVDRINARVEALTTR